MKQYICDSCGGVIACDEVNPISVKWEPWDAHEMHFCGYACVREGLGHAYIDWLESDEEVEA